MAPLWQTITLDNPPQHCACGSTDFKWDKGFKGNSLTPPEPSGWYCHECGSRDYDDFNQPGVE